VEATAAPYTLYEEDDEEGRSKKIWRPAKSLSVACRVCAVSTTGRAA
jgi:hypothetical protein